MSGGSLRDQLKALGLVKPKPASAPLANAPASKPARKEQQDQPCSDPAGRAHRKSPKTTTPARAHKEVDAEISLAKAYAAKLAAEQAEAAALRRQQEEKARLKRERKTAAIKLLEGKSLVKSEAELPRHFEYGKKIRRIYVDAEQLRALNGGQLGVAQLDGKFMLVDANVIDELQRVAPEFVALRVDPNAVPDEEPIPDHLHW